MAGERAPFFRWSELRRFLGLVASIRRVTSIRRWDGGDALVLRHDVDCDLGAAERLADIEVDAGVDATYCVMTTSDLYNAAAPASRAILRRLAAKGFDIGLHFWPAAYSDGDEARMAARVRDEAHLLEDIVGTEIVSLSLHNPSATNRYPRFDGYRGAYDAELFSSGRYLSDSRMVLREDPLSFAQRTRGAVAQLLLHPEHFTETGAGYEEIFEGVERRRASTVDHYMSVNETYARDMPSGLFESLRRRARPEV